VIMTLGACDSAGKVMITMIVGWGAVVIMELWLTGGP